MLLSGMHIDLPDASLRPRPWRGDRVSGRARAIPEETALALTYNGGTYALMMGTPCDLDFAIGFSLNAGIVESADAIESLELVRVENAIELQMWLARVKAARLSGRRRHIAGPTGCGLCGIDSIAEAVGPAAIVGPGPTFSSDQIMAAMRSTEVIADAASVVSRRVEGENTQAVLSA
jgi:FdhD protein